MTAPTVCILAAGSLMRAFAALAEAYVAQAPGTHLLFRHGPAGLLREEIEAGAYFDVFASADIGHAEALVAIGLATDIRPFARNRLVATIRSDLGLHPDGLIATLLDPDVRLATSTPGADPSGDYAERFFDNVEAALPGKGAVLRAKALRLVGGRNTPPVPQGRAAAAWLIAEDRADVVLGYGNHAAACLSEGHVDVVPLPEDLAPVPIYGFCRSLDAVPAATPFCHFLASETGQAILAEYGFQPI